MEQWSRIAQIDPLLKRTTTILDAANQTVASVNGLGHWTTLTYNAAGDRARSTDPRGFMKRIILDSNLPRSYEELVRTETGNARRTGKR